MPFYVYTCPDCGRDTELLRPAAQRDQPARCEACGSERAVRGAASFASALGAGTSSGSRGTSCGGGGGFT